MTLSVCLIVKDEQDVIGRCLNRVAKFADEIVVVDTGSTDDTVAQVKKFTDKVFFFQWCDDFSAARNFAFEKATCDLVMWLDADDVITDENCEKINDLKTEFGSYDMAVLPYAAAFDGDVPTFVYMRERIFKRVLNFRFTGAVHEAIAPQGKILYSDATVYHKKVKENKPLRNLGILQKQIALGAGLDERQKFYYGRELLFNKMYLESAAVLEDFLNGSGWVVNKVEACINLYTVYAALGDERRALASLLRSLTFLPPGGQTCCILGEHFLKSGDYNSSVYWYKAALNSGENEKSGGFINRDFNGFIPLIQLCVLYDKLGEYDKAYAYNERAGQIKPDNANYLNNKKYFEKLGIRGKIDD